jgi:hypothetical protein
MGADCIGNRSTTVPLILDLANELEKMPNAVDCSKCPDFGLTGKRKRGAPAVFSPAAKSAPAAKKAKTTLTLVSNDSDDSELELEPVAMYTCKMRGKMLKPNHHVCGMKFTTPIATGMCVHVCACVCVCVCVGVCVCISLSLALFRSQESPTGGKEACSKEGGQWQHSTKDTPP